MNQWISESITQSQHMNLETLINPLEVCHCRSQPRTEQQWQTPGKNMALSASKSGRGSHHLQWEVAANQEPALIEVGATSCLFSTSTQTSLLSPQAWASEKCLPPPQPLIALGEDPLPHSESPLEFCSWLFHGQMPPALSVPENLPKSPSQMVILLEVLPH